MLMNRRRAAARDLCKHLRCTSCRSKKDRIGPYILQTGDHCRYSRRLAGAGITIDHQNIRIVTGHEISNIVEQRILARCRFCIEALDEFVLEKARPVHHEVLLLNIIPTQARTG